MSAASAGMPDKQAEKETKEEVLERLESTASGLSAQEAENRIAKLAVYKILESEHAHSVYFGRARGAF